MAVLRPFLVMRVLGVIPLGQMSGPHAMACLAKIAELASPAFNPSDWCATVPAGLEPDRAGQLRAEHGPVTVSEDRSG